jgi:hypothetical protein
LGAKLLVLLRDGFGTFTINFPHQGAVTLIKALDYEKGEGFKKFTLFSCAGSFKECEKVCNVNRAFTNEL